jgi:hypothetical protein
MSKRSSKTKTQLGQLTKSDGVSVLAVFVIGIGLLAGYHFLVAPTGVAEASSTHSGPAQNIVVVDSKTVLEAFMRQMEGRIAAGENFTESEIQTAGVDFGAEYLRAIKKYRDAGYLVIDKKYALGVPSGSEITEEIGKALSLEVKATPDPFQAPELN